MRKLRVLDLFSGIGGFSLGLERTGGFFETAAFCEYAEFPRKVLAKHWPDVPCFPDVRELKGSDIDGPVDIIVGGYPCQPFSTAGQRRGQEDDRHLWPEFNRLVAELRPSWVIGENVAGHISMGLDDVLSDLEGQGYAARTFVIPACATDAPHRRDRVWTVAHAKRIRQQGSGEHEQPSDCQTQREGQANHVEPERQSRKWSAEPAMGRMADGISRRMDGHCRWLDEPDIPRVAKGVKDRANRLKALGNAVVPQIPEIIGYAILQAEEAKQ